MVSNAIPFVGPPLEAQFLLDPVGGTVTDLTLQKDMAYHAKTFCLVCIFPVKPDSLALIFSIDIL